MCTTTIRKYIKLIKQVIIRSSFRSRNFLSWLVMINSLKCAPNKVSENELKACHDQFLPSIYKAQHIREHYPLLAHFSVRKQFFSPHTLAHSQWNFHNSSRDFSLVSSHSLTLFDCRSDVLFFSLCVRSLNSKISLKTCTTTTFRYGREGRARVSCVYA